jgi:hypothetical protein
MGVYLSTKHEDIENEQAHGVVDTQYRLQHYK